MIDVPNKYKYIEHTADIKFQSYGNSLEELFSNSLLAMFNSFVEMDEIKPIIEKELKIESDSLEEHLFDFLEEFLFLMDADNFLPKEVTLIEIKKNNNKYILIAKVVGDLAKHYDFSGDIKSITYHDMFIKNTEGKYTAQVVLDV